LPAFVRAVPRLAEIVADILKADGFVVTLDWKDFSKDTFNALILPLGMRDIMLQE
jgi:flavodoxin